VSRAKLAPGCAEFPSKRCCGAARITSSGYVALHWITHGTWQIRSRLVTARKSSIWSKPICALVEEELPASRFSSVVSNHPSGAYLSEASGGKRLRPSPCCLLEIDRPWRIRPSLGLGGGNYSRRHNWCQITLIDARDLRRGRTVHPCSMGTPHPVAGGRWLYMQLSRSRAERNFRVPSTILNSGLTR